MLIKLYECDICGTVINPRWAKRYIVSLNVGVPGKQVERTMDVCPYCISRFPRTLGKHIIEEAKTNV